jgi:hypothetical protein
MINLVVINFDRGQHFEMESCTACMMYKFKENVSLCECELAVS